MVEENTALRKEVAELRRANEILKAAAFCFGAELCATRLRNREAGSNLADMAGLQ